MSEAEDLRSAETEPFGKLLERLITVKKHSNGRPYSVAEVAEGVGISKSQLYNLINGTNEPKLRLAQQLAAYFGVDLEYFGTSQRARELQEQYALLAKLTAQGVRDVALRASALSPDALSNVRAFIDFQASRQTPDGHTSE
ncbi:helix-turn-helix domain-containing protein [Amycolatopsis sp. NPDC049252]|uniref:helix-turn-helix domain-containing protein n=1 Tax=Amycolatopsis sp. NPDC049252 TaxID=3363933 RepID=UPI003723E2E3